MKWRVMRAGPLCSSLATFFLISLPIRIVNTLSPGGSFLKTLTTQFSRGTPDSSANSLEGTISSQGWVMRKSGSESDGTGSTMESRGCASALSIFNHRVPLAPPVASGSSPLAEPVAHNPNFKE